MPNWASVIKLFAAIIYEFVIFARVFVPCKPFQPSLTLASKTVPML